MRTAFYARVLTQRQAQADGVAQQLDRLQGHAQSQGWPVADEDIFRDDGYSGAHLKRPGLERLRDLVALRVLDRVLITAPDRLARHYVHQVLLLEEITGSGLPARVPRPADEPGSPRPAPAADPRRRGGIRAQPRRFPLRGNAEIAERMRRGRLRKLQAGLLLPWTRLPYGFRLDPERPRDPAGVRQDEAEAAVVAALFALYAEERCSLFSLARKLQRDAVLPPRAGRRWNMTTVRQILTNPVYTGQIYAGRIQEACGTGAAATTRRVWPREDWIAVAPVPAVVTQEQFDRVQDKLAQNQQFARRNNTAHAYLLRALVSCGVCGLSCSGRCPSPGYRYYQCRGKLAAVHSHRDTICPSRHIPAAQLDALVWDDLCQMLTHPGTIRLALERAHGGHWLPQELQARCETLRRGQAGLQRQVERLTEAYLAGVVGLDEYQRRRRDLEQREHALAGQERQLGAQVDRQVELARLGLSMEEFCRRVSQGLKQASWEQKRQLIEWLVARVVVTDGEVEIRYVIPTSPAGEAAPFCHLRSDYRNDDGPLQAPDRAQAARSHSARSAWRGRACRPGAQPHDP